MASEHNTMSLLTKIVDLFRNITFFEDYHFTSKHWRHIHYAVKTDVGNLGTLSQFHAELSHTLSPENFCVNALRIT